MKMTLAMKRGIIMQKVRISSQKRYTVQATSNFF